MRERDARERREEERERAVAAVAAEEAEAEQLIRTELNNNKLQAVQSDDRSSSEPT